MPPTFSDEGVKAALVIRKQWPDVSLLMLSQYVEERYAVDLIAGDSRGIGYLLKDRVADVGDFLEALKRVAAGGAALDPEVVTQLLVRSGRKDPLDPLSPREREVLGADGRGAHQRLDRRRAGRHRGRRREARDQHLHQARPAARRPGASPRTGRAALPRVRGRSQVSARADRIVALLAGGVLSLIFVACSAVQRRGVDRPASWREKRHRDIPGPVRELRITAGGGDVQLMPVARTGTSASTAASGASLDTPQLDVDFDGSDVAVHGGCPEMTLGHCEATLLVGVPVGDRGARRGVVR